VEPFGGAQVEQAMRALLIGLSIMFTIPLTILGGAALGTESNSSGIFSLVAGLLTFIIMIFLFVIVDNLPGPDVYKKCGEFGATLFLWILWFAVSGSSVSRSGFQGSCTRYALSESGEADVRGCQETSAIYVLGLLNGICYLFYNAVQLFVSVCYGDIDDSTPTNLTAETSTPTNFTAARINNTRIAVNNEISPPNDSPV